MTQRRGTVDLDYTQAQLERAGLSHAAERLSELVEEAAKQDLSSHRFLDRLLEVEIGEREERRIKTSLRLSGLPPGQTLGNFDFAFQPSMKKSRVETLATCAWIREHATTLIAGPPGTGKTHIAVALGVKAIENGFSVAFYRLDDLLHAMKRDVELAPQRMRRKKYNKVSMLIIDEVGFQPMSRDEASHFFRLISYALPRLICYRGRPVASRKLLPVVTTRGGNVWGRSVRESGGKSWARSGSATIRVDEMTSGASWMSSWR